LTVCVQKGRMGTLWLAVARTKLVGHSALKRELTSTEF